MAADDAKPSGIKWKLIGTLAAVLLILAVVGASLLYVRKQRQTARLVDNRDRGYELLEAGDPDAALPLIGGYVNVFKNDAQATFRYAQARQQIEMPRDRHLGEAFYFYGEALRLDPTLTQARTELLELAAELGEDERVLELTADTTAASDDPAALAARSRALLRGNELDEALALSKRHHELVPGDVQQHVLTLNLLRQLGRGGDEVVAHADEVAPTLGEETKGLVLRAVAAALNNDSTASLDLAEQAAEVPITDGDTLNLLADLLDRGGRFDLTLQIFEQSAEAVADDRTLRRTLLDRLFQAGLDEEIVRRTSDLDAADPRADARLLGLRGVALKRLDRPADAAAIADALANRANAEGTRSEAWAAFIDLWPLPDQPGTAPAQIADDFAKLHAALEIDVHPIGVFLLGELLQRFGETEAATTAYEFAGRRFAAWPDPWLRHARLMQQLDRPRAAIATLREALRRGGGDPDTLAEAAGVAARFGARQTIDQARELLDQALAADPDHPAALALRININKELGEPFEEDLAALAERDDLPPQIVAQLAALAQDTPFADHFIDRPVADPAAALQLAIMKLPGDPDLPAPIGIADATWQAVKLQQRRDGTPEEAERIAALADDNPRLVVAQELAALAGEPIARRRSAARLVELLEGRSLRWATTVALLDLQKDEPTEQELAAVALDLSEVTRRYPQAVDPRLALADTLDQLGQENEALDQLEAAIAGRPDLARLRLLVASRHLRTGRADDADAQLRAVEQLAAAGRATDDERRRAAAMLEFSGETDRALDLLQPLADGDEPDLQRLRLERAANRLTDARLQELAASGNPTLVAFAAETYAARGDVGQSLAALDQLPTEQMTDVQRQSLRADRALINNDAAGAEAAMRAAVDADPQQPASRRRLANFLLSQGRIDDAIAAATFEAADGTDAQAAALADFARLNDILGNDYQTLAQFGVLDLAASLLSNVADNPAAEQALAALAAARREETPIVDLADDVTVAATKAEQLVPLQLLRAQLDLAANRPGRAARVAEELGRRNPRLAAAPQLQAQALAQQGDFVNALTAAERWGELAPSDPVATIFQAEARLALEQFTLAESLLRPLIERDDLPQAKLLWGRALTGAGRGPRAFDVLQPLLSDALAVRLWWYDTAAEQAQPLAAAEAALSTAAAEAGDSLNERVVLLRAYRTLAERDLSPEDAERINAEIERRRAPLVEQALQPGAPTSLIMELAVSLDDVDPQTQETLYRAAVAQDSPVARNNLAMLLVKKGTPSALEEARELAEQVAARDGDPAQAFYVDTLGVVKRAAGDYDGAIAAFYEAIRLAPQNPIWHVELAETQLQANQPAAARTSLVEAARRTRQAGNPPDLVARVEALEAELRPEG
jgi:predicted Zn-dependent protease